MASYLDYLFPMGQTMQPTPGLLSEDEAKRMRQQAQQAGLLNFGANLLAASGPTTQQMTFGQRLAPALLSGVSAAQGTVEQQQNQLAQRQKAMLEQEKLNQPKYERLTTPSGGQALVEIVRGRAPSRVDIAGMGSDEKPIDFSPLTRAWMKNNYGTTVFENLTSEQQRAARSIEEAQKTRTASLMGGIDPNAMPVGKEGTNVVDRDLLGIGRARVGLQRTMAQFDPEYLTIPFQAKMKLATTTERLGGTLAPDVKDSVTKYSQFVQTSMRDLNQYINDITGAAIGSGEEEARIRAGIPDPQKDSPTQFEAKLQNTLALGKLYEARLGYVKRNGLKLTDVSVDSIPAKMRAREAEIIQQLKLDPTKPEDKAAIRSRLANEFGLLD
jgi:hypothetical protein